MRIAVIADIHGNQIALESVLQDLSRQPAVDHLVIAGDLCLNGPRPREVLHILQELQCPVLQGNVDVEVVVRPKQASAKKLALIDWTREQIQSEGIAYLAGLPFSQRIVNRDGRDALIVHANPVNREEHLFPDLQESKLQRLLGGLGLEIGALAFGHLHIAYVRYWRQLLLCDVGSCGLPRDGDQRASYGILTWRDVVWQAEIRRVGYDIKAVIEQLATSGIPQANKRISVLKEARYAEETRVGKLF